MLKEVEPKTESIPIKTIIEKMGNDKEFVILEVTSKRLYVFSKEFVQSNKGSKEKLINDWFIKTPLSKFHTIRDRYIVALTRNLEEIPVKVNWSECKLGNKAFGKKVERKYRALVALCEKLVNVSV